MAAHGVQSRIPREAGLSELMDDWYRIFCDSSFVREDFDGGIYSAHYRDQRSVK